VKSPEGSLNFSFFAVFLGSKKNIEERAVHNVPETIPTVWRRLLEWLFISHKKKNYVMVMNTHSGSQINQQGRVQPEPVIQPNLNLEVQNNPQPPSFPPPSGGDHDRITALEAHIEALTQQNAKLLLKILGQFHPEVNQDEREEEERNSHTNGHDHRKDNHQEDNFREDNHREQRNKRANCHGDQREDVGDLSIIVAKLEIRCTYMEMEMKDKNKSIVVDKLLLGTSSPFTRRVANYRLLKKFKVPHILNYVGNGDPLDDLENFRAHLDLHGTPNEIACWAFPLTLSRNAWDLLRKIPPNSVNKFK
jgi:hypothetical protein